MSHRDALSLFPSNVWAYYLPAYLIASIRSGDPDLVDDAVSSLVPLRDERWAWRWFGQRRAELNAAQRAAVGAFVELMWLRHREDFPCGMLDAARQLW
jgi:hypothetical protein